MTTLRYLVTLAAGVVFISGCSTTRPPIMSSDGQLLFRDLDQAATALKTAVKNNDTAELAKIFGPDSKDLINSGDPTADSETLRMADALMSEQTSMVPVEKPDRPGQSIYVLVVGKAGWPFPIPLVEDGGRWRFDTADGKEEIINRRIGRNELAAISVCRGYVNAQREYQAMPHDGTRSYAAKIMSTPGQQDGLFWEPTPGQPRSPLGPFVARAAEEGYRSRQDGQPVAYHGYHFRVLTAQGRNAPGGAKNYLSNGKMMKGFALVAYPVRWGESGVMTFIVGPDGVVNEKDLGADTTERVASMTAYDPDSSWARIGA